MAQPHLPHPAPAAGVFLTPTAGASRPHALALAAAAALTAPPAWAQAVQAPAAAASAAAPAARAEATVMPRLVVTATRIETPQDEVPATVTTKTAQDIEREQARDIKTLLDREPGVAVRRQPARMSAVFSPTGRGGNEGINVRGLEGNQVLLQSDGVRLPMVYESGPYVAGRGDYIDVEAFKQVELLRGPSSASYGSDGLAGAVSFVTKDPRDLLTLGKPWQAGLKLGYASADKSWVAVPTFALREGAFEAMVLASLRRGHELDNQGDVGGNNVWRTQPNPQDHESDYVLAKGIWKITPAHQLKATFEHLEREVRTDPIYTVVGMAFVNANVIDANGLDRNERTLGKLDYQYTDARNPWIQRASAWIYAQDTENRQLGQERYNSPPAAWARRTRDTRYGERNRGFGAQAESSFGQAVPQRLLVGVDFSNSNVHSYKDGAHYAADGSLITSGSASASLSFPNQSFPDTDYRLLGAFVQDEITLGDWLVTPALRLDRFELVPETGNPLYTRNNTVAPSRLEDQEVSPRLGVVWKLAPIAQPYAQYAHGFRAPTPWQVNGGLSNPTASPPYRTIGNSDLKPETSDSFELGLRGTLAGVRYSLAVFKSRYRNFIIADNDVTATTTVPLDPGMAGNTRTFQSINAARADIRGWEATAMWEFVRGWTVDAGCAHAKGDQRSGAAFSPLSTIEPDKGTLKLTYERANAWGGEVALTGQKSQRRPHNGTALVPKGYVVGDVAAWWDLTRQVQIVAAVQNVGDVKYALWTDLRGVAGTTVGTDAYTQPGRNFSASLRYVF